MINHPWECHLDMSPHSSYMILQICTFYHKIISIGVIFLLILLFYFLRTPLHELAFYSFTYPLCLFPSYLNHVFVCFNQISPTIYLMYPLHVKEFISWNWHVYKLTTEHTLHSRVKRSIAQTLDCCFLLKL